MANVAAPFRNIVLAAFAFAVLSSTAGTVAAEAESVATEEQQGARVLRAVEDGKRPCTDLSTQEFERVGEYVMWTTHGAAFRWSPAASA